MSLADLPKRFKYGPSQDYELQESIEADGEIPVYHYVNKVTGLKIFLGYVEYPLVRADMAFATETHDDDGLPHTLEHLIFMGSEEYPYKGLLDMFANQSFANGTNASTATDYTSYDVAHAGAEGFLNLLPIYLDHLFFASLSDDAYLTEIHHINGRGEDAGVVYCEMQSRENSGESRCERELVRHMYPGKCGYKSETGGMMKNIRTTLNNEKIKKYHSQYYVPKNFCMIITGPVHPEALFKAIQPIEEKLHQRFGNLPPMERPWSSKVPPLEESVEKTIQYPCDSKEDGLVYLGYRGPSCGEFRECLALTLLTEYLNQPTISPFQREFIECENPYCSSIDVDMVENTVSYFYFTFEAVQMDMISQVADKVNEILGGLVSGKEKFDIDRMRVIISRRIVNLLLTCERNPHSHVSNASLSHFLYGQGSMKDKFQMIPILDSFQSVDESFWLSLINKYMVGPEARSVCINGEPSPELLAIMTEEEEKRIKNQQETLGDRLVLNEESLEKALKNHNKPIPPELLNKLQLPSVDSIKFLPIKTVTPNDTRLPITLTYDIIQTKFVSIYLALDTSHCLNEDQRMYIPLLEQMLFESPIFRDGKLIPHEQVIKELYTDTISMDISTGVSGALSNLLLINFQVEVKNYSKAVNWIHEILFNIKFSEERIRTLAKRITGDISQLKRDGEQITHAATNSLLYQANSNLSAENFMKQQAFLKGILKKLKTDPETVLSEILAVKNSITNNAKIMYAHLSLGEKDFPKEEDIIQPWFNFLPGELVKTSWDEKRFDQSAIIPNHELVKLEKDKILGIAIASGSVESGYFRQAAPSIIDPFHDDLPALSVLIEYFIQLEGPLWRKLRGEGLSYNYSMGLRPSSGMLWLIISYSAQLVDAFNRFVEVVVGQLDNEIPFEDHLFRSAKSSLIYKFISHEKNPSSRSGQSLVGYLLGIGADYDRNMLTKIANVKYEDLHRVGKEHLSTLFKGSTRCAAVCCHPMKLKQVLAGMNEMGCNLKASSLESLAS